MILFAKGIRKWYLPFFFFRNFIFFSKSFRSLPLLLIFKDNLKMGKFNKSTCEEKKRMWSKLLYIRWSLQRPSTFIHCWVVVWLWAVEIQKKSWWKALAKSWWWYWSRMKNFLLKLKWEDKYRMVYYILVQTLFLLILLLLFQKRKTTWTEIGLEW